MEYLVSPLTKNMLADLQKIRAIHISGNKQIICAPHEFKGSLAGLSGRGLIHSKKVQLNGKKMIRVFITQSGINFLNKYDQDVIMSFSRRRLMIVPGNSWQGNTLN